MTYEEAIEIIKNTSICLARGNGKLQFFTALKIAIKALEKQIPKKPIKVDTNSGESRYRCPACGEMQTDLEGFTFEYPSCRCGQRLNWNLDWSDEK